MVAGVIFTVSAPDSFTLRVNCDGITLMPSARVGITVRVISSLSPALLVALIFTFPTLTAVTTPVVPTVAILLLSLVHTIDLSVASSGDTIAVNEIVSPTLNWVEGGV